MKKLLIAVAVASTLIAPQAFAQTKNFEGFSLGANVNFVGASTELSAPAVAIRMGETSQNLSLQAAYGFAIGNTSVLSLGLNYGVGDLAGGSIDAGANRYKLKVTNSYSLYIEPGFVVSESTLVYGKLAYLSAKGVESLNAFSGSANFNGTGFGAGIRTMLSKNLYLQAEFLQSNYTQKSFGTSGYKPTASIGTVGIGYKF